MERTRAAAVAVVGLTAVLTHAAPKPVRFELVSVTAGGASADGASDEPSISANGRYVAFSSGARDLGAESDGQHVYLRDRLRGTTTLVSVGPSGAPGDATSRGASVSANGRFVAFESEATNLGSANASGVRQVYVRDLRSGTTSLVSASSGGEEGDGNSGEASVSADGRFVAFLSTATNLAPEPTAGQLLVYVHDRRTRTTELISVTAEGLAPTGSSYGPRISPDGRHVVFASDAVDLVPADVNGVADIFVRDRARGVTQLVSRNSGGEPADGTSRRPSVSMRGRHVAFETFATNFGPTPGSQFQIVVRDVVKGVVRIVSRNAAGESGTDNSAEPRITPSGRHVAFYSSAENLSDDDGNRLSDAFVADLRTGRLQRVAADTVSDGNVRRADVSASGRVVAISSNATNLVPGDENGLNDVFVATLR